MEALHVLALLDMKEVAITAQVSPKVTLGTFTRSVYVYYSCSTLDVDECQMEIDNCDINAQCSDNVGSFLCTCNIGYSGDGVTCSKWIKWVIAICKRMIL